MNQYNDRIIAPPAIETFESLLKLLTRDRYGDKEYYSGVGSIDRSQNRQDLVINYYLNLKQNQLLIKLLRKTIQIFFRWYVQG